MRLIALLLIFSCTHVSADTKVDLSDIPEHLCGKWAYNVSQALRHSSPDRFLTTWLMHNRADKPYIILAKFYIENSNIKEVDNVFGTANADCLKALRGTYI